jgi:Uma2 family endonuclease
MEHPQSTHQTSPQERDKSAELAEGARGWHLCQLRATSSLVSFGHTPPHTGIMSPLTATLLTADQFIASGDRRHRWTELVNGEIVMTNPTIRHQRIVQFIQFAILRWLEAAPGRGDSPGQLDIKIDDETVLAPDVLWASDGRIPADGTHLDVAPELVVEVRSPSTWRYDTTVKFRKYEKAGVAEVWLVDTAAHTVLVYRRSTPSTDSFDVALELGSDEHLETALLPGLTVNIGELFNR